MEDAAREVYTMNGFRVFLKCRHMIISRYHVFLSELRKANSSFIGINENESDSSSLSSLSVIETDEERTRDENRELYITL